MHQFGEVHYSTPDTLKTKITSFQGSFDTPWVKQKLKKDFQDYTFLFRYLNSA